MNKLISLFKTNSSISLIFATLLSSTLVGCGTGSGEETTQRPNTSQTTSTDSNYSGPAPTTSDVQSFKLNVWDNLVDTDRCGTCHSTGGQSPVFVHDGNINTAYAAANTVINLNAPSQSAMVSKMAGGHNCWLASDSACADIITSYIENWAGGSAGSATQVVLRAPSIKDPGASKSFPDNSTDFGTTVYPLLTQYCNDCHVEGIQTPYLASNDVDVAYTAAQSKMDLGAPPGSRLVLRLRDEFHNCWDGNCADSANDMELAIEAFAATISTTPMDPDLVISKALTLSGDGLLANAGGRYEDNIIALYEFKTGEDTTAYDTSGIEPALDLTLSGNVSWVGGWGINIGPAYFDDDNNINVNSGKAQGTTSNSKKLHDLMTASGEYSIEAWVAPDNVTQEDARIITYSGASDARNFTLGQTLYNYDFLHRSSTTDQNEALSTADADERLQASLQHIVISFSPGEARRIYVNGEYTGDIDGEAAGNLSEWDDSFALVLGNETDGNSLWQGTLRMVAVHNRALTEEQIQQNYNVGVGEKFYLLFSVSHLIDVPESFFVFEVSQFDSYSYLFTEPFFISLDETATPDMIPVKNLKLGINGKEAVIGQAYRNIDLSLNSSDYIVGSGQTISEIGTIIPLEQGSDSDEFFLSFEVLGDNTNVVVEAAPLAPPELADEEPVADIGLKTFDEINASMSTMTGVAKTNTAVASTYTTVKQQLPTLEAIDGFLSAHQMAVTQLAIQYCDALVEDSSLRSSFFPGFDFTASVSSAFDTTGRNQITSNLLDKLVGDNLNTQPSNIDVETELNSLIDTLSNCAGSCASDRTETVVKATCAAVLGSATTLVQ